MRNERGITMSDVFSDVFDDVDNKNGGSTPDGGNKPATKSAPLVSDEQLVASMEETIANDPTYLKRKGSLSAGLTVVKVLTYSDQGNIKLGPPVQAKDKKTKEPIFNEDGTPKMVPSRIKTPKNVGYILKNTTGQDLPYTIESWAKNADGIYEPTMTEKVFKNGTTAIFSRRWLAIFASRDEISLKFANGRLKVSSSKEAEKKAKVSELEAYYAACESLYVRLDEDQGSVNADNLKTAIATKKTDKEGNVIWDVKKEYLEVFGYLMNPVEKGKGGRKTSTKTEKDYDGNDLYANFINKSARKFGLAK